MYFLNVLPSKSLPADACVGKNTSGIFYASFSSASLSIASP